MALGIKHTLLRELRTRVLIYDISMTLENRDRLIIAARAVAKNFDEARADSLARGNESRRRCWQGRVERGLCQLCGRRPHRPQRKSCEECGRRQARNADRCRRS